MDSPDIRFTAPTPIPPLKKPSRLKFWRLLGGGLAVGITLMIVTIVLAIWWYNKEVSSPPSPSGSIVSLTVEPGASVSQIADQLEQAKLIDNPTAFRIYVKLNGLGDKLQSGAYKLPQNISIEELSQRLQSAKRDEAVLRFTEGWRREEMAEYIESQHQQGLIDMTGEQFSALALEPTAELRAILGDRLPADASLHGFLFPDTYIINKDETAAELITRMLSNYNNKVTESVRKGFAEQGLTEYEAVNLAAIIERESRQGDERAVVAGILLTRLHNNIALGVDATLQYTLGYSEAEKRWWRHGLTEADLALDTPYNTRRVLGLPPRPIANPSLSALQAVATPTDSNYLFYIHDTDGVIHYARTLAEHNANIARYLR